MLQTELLMILCVPAIVLALSPSSCCPRVHLTDFQSIIKSPGHCFFFFWTVAGCAIDEGFVNGLEELLRREQERGPDDQNHTGAKDDTEHGFQKGDALADKKKNI